MELLATMALDRDAVNTVILRLLPPSTATAAATSWLLLHTIPITASLSRTLSRLVSIEEAAMAQASPQEAVLPASASRRLSGHTSSPASSGAVSPAASPFPSVPRAGTPASPSLETSLNVVKAGWVELVRVGYVISEIHAYCILVKCHTAGQAVRMKAALEEGAALGVTAPVEFVSDAQPVVVTHRTFAEVAGEERVADGACEEATEGVQREPVAQLSSVVTTGSVLNSKGGDFTDEVLSQTRSTDVHLLRSLEAPHHSSAGSSSVPHAPAFPATLPASTTTDASSAHTPHHQSSSFQQQQQQHSRWRTETHTMSLLDAITAVYPLRDEVSEASGCGATSGGRGVLSDGSGEDEPGDGAGCSRSHDASHEQSRSIRAMQHQHQPQQTGTHMQRSPYAHQQHPVLPLRRPGSDYALSAPSSPSLLLRQASPMPLCTSPPPSTATAATASTPMRPMRGGMTKGAAPPISRHAAARAQQQQNGHPAHTPLQLPKPSVEHARTTPLLQLDISGAAHAAPHDEFCAICQVDPLRTSACVTTLCQHFFHLHCYAQLPSGSAECPLCRFSVYDLLNDARCEVCGTYEDLWVCLICGHVACGRARRDHQQEHYRASGHSCSWQSSTNRIWNLSSRMFLHQEVALLLDGAEDEPFSTGGGDEQVNAGAGGRSDSSMDRLRLMSWAEPFDSDLQEALNESKEEAVAQYYTAFLRQLAEEQQRWYEEQLAEVRRRRERRQRRAVAQAQAQPSANATPVHAGSATPPQVPTSAAQTVHAIAREERRQRRRVLADYVAATIPLLQQAQRDYTALYQTLKASRDDAQQQVLLRSHFNSGLVSQMDQVRQRTQEATRKGERNAQQKTEEEARLQKRVDEALSAL